MKLTRLGLVFLLTQVCQDLSVFLLVSAEENCTASEYLDLTVSPSICRPCTICYNDTTEELVPCNQTQDSVCATCPPSYVYRLRIGCIRCGACCEANRWIFEPECGAALGVGYQCAFHDSCGNGNRPREEDTTSSEGIEDTVEVGKSEHRERLKYVIVLGSLCMLLMLMICVLLSFHLTNKLNRHKDTRAWFPEFFFKKTNTENVEEDVRPQLFLTKDALQVIEEASNQWGKRPRSVRIEGPKGLVSVLRSDGSVSCELVDESTHPKRIYPAESSSFEAVAGNFLGKVDLESNDGAGTGLKRTETIHCATGSKCYKLSQTLDDDCKELKTIDGAKGPITQRCQPKIDSSTEALILGGNSILVTANVHRCQSVSEEDLPDQGHFVLPEYDTSSGCYEIISDSGENGTENSGSKTAISGGNETRTSGGNGSGGTTSGDSGGNQENSGTKEKEGKDNGSEEGDENGAGDYSYVDFYNRIVTTLRKCGVTFVGHLGAGKSALKDALLGNPFSETASTNGIDLSSCEVSTIQLETQGSIWTEKSGTSLRGQCRDLDSLVAEHVLPNIDQDEGETTYGIENIPKYERNASEMSLWDMSGEFAFYKTHQMFLFPSNVFLVVMDITKDLDEDLPQSCATKPQTGKIECPRTPREFLDFWLNSICTYTNFESVHDDSGFDPSLEDDDYHIVIVLTHTDLLDVEDRKDTIEIYKQNILKHVKSQYACRYVLNEVYDVSNIERDENGFNRLRNKIMNLCQTKPEYGVVKPCTWLKCEETIQILRDNSDIKLLPFEHFQQLIGDPLGMDEDEVQDFLSFQSSYGNLIVNQDLKVICIDPQYLVDVFKAVITMWQFRNISDMNLSIQKKVEEQLESGILSKNLLKILWEKLAQAESDLELLTSLMTSHGLFIKQGHERHIVPALLPPSPFTEENPENFDPFHEVQGAICLMYLLHNSSVAGEIKSSAFLPTGLFPVLLASLMEGVPGETEPWELVKMFYSAATFRAGGHGEYMIKVSYCTSVLTLRVFAVETEKDIQKLRIQFEKTIKTIMELHFPNLHCSVCVCPCDKIGAPGLKVNCLQILGPLGEVDGAALKTAACFNPDCPKRKHLPIRNYERWFSDHNNDVIITEKIMRTVAKLVCDWDGVYDIGITLGVASDTITRIRNENETLFLTAFCVVKHWDQNTLGNSSAKYRQLQDAVEEVFNKRWTEIIV